MAKKNITITQYASELIYDIQNKTFLTGRSRSTGANHEEVAHMQAGDDDEDINQILRSVGNALSALKTKLSEYINSNETTANDAQINKNSNITISLAMPSNYNSATVDTIAAAVHQYLVNSAVGEWFTITNKNDAGDYITMAAANLEQIREALNKRIRPTRTTISGV